MKYSQDLRARVCTRRLNGETFAKIGLAVLLTQWSALGRTASKIWTQCKLTHSAAPIDKHWRRRVDAILTVTDANWFVARLMCQLNLTCTSNPR